MPSVSIVRFVKREITTVTLTATRASHQSWLLVGRDHINAAPQLVLNTATFRLRRREADITSADMRVLTRLADLARN